MKSGLENFFLKFIHAEDYFSLLHKGVQNHKFSNENNHLHAWRDFKITFSRPIFTIIFKPKMVISRLWSLILAILGGLYQKEFVSKIYLLLYVLKCFFQKVSEAWVSQQLQQCQIFCEELLHSSLCHSSPNVHLYCSGSTGKSLSEALFFAEHGENMLCTKIVLNVRNNFCTKHVLPRFELGIFMY